MAMPIPVAAQTNSMSAVSTTPFSFAANLAKSTGALTGPPSGTMLSMAAAEQAMNRTPSRDGVSSVRAHLDLLRLCSVCGHLNLLLLLVVVPGRVRGD